MSVVHLFCLSVCLSTGLLQRESADFIETWCYDWAYQSEELVNLLVVIRSRIQIPYHFSTSLTIAEWILDLVASLIQSPADFHDTRRND